ncbi:MAG: trypsin-like peptidase domain-containing protein [Clostridiales bacterium]|jgi:serine protease Do|nr:trypsin-like peptidase domain-containing protein [Clostridiales bacterium]
MSYFQEERPKSRVGIWILMLLLVIAVGFGSAFITWQIVGSQNTVNEPPSAAELPNNNQPQSNLTQQGAPDLGNAEPPDLEEQATLITSIANKVGPAVVGITNFSSARDLFRGEQEIEQSAGSGVIISNDGYIITNDHVISGANRLMVSLADGRQVEADVIGTDPRSDLAVIKVAESNLTVAQFGDSDQLQVGELAVAIGNPGGNDFARSVTVGYLSGLNRQITTAEGQRLSLIQTDAAINPGNSGGALLNSKGQLIGINTIKIASSYFEGMGFAIPCNTARDIADSLIKNGKVIRPALGVSLLRDITPSLARYNNLVVDYGVMVMPAAGSPADRAGMMDNDIVIAVDDKKIESGSQLQDEIFSRRVGEEVNVTVVRKDENVVLTVILGELGD